MKKIVYIFLGFGLLLVASCDDGLLDQFTPGALTEEIAVQNSDDLQKLINVAYSQIEPISEYTFNSVFTDEVGIGFANGGQGLTDNYAFILNASSASAEGIWTTNYFALAYINRVIKYADRIVAVDADDQLIINRIKAEALTLRAHCHLQLISYFSSNPKDRDALGVILSNDVFPTSYTAPRVTNGVVYDLIDADLESALELYNNVDDATNPIYANKYFAEATIARSYALRGDYTNALFYCNDIIDNSGLTLASGNNYRDMFHNDVDAEVIFKLKVLVNQTRIGSVWASVNSTVTGSPFYEMGRSLFNNLNTTNFSNATDYVVTGITNTSLIIPGNNLQVNDMFVSPVSIPQNATVNTAGTGTTPSGALIAGKVYFVKSVLGDLVTLTDTFNSTVNISLSAAANPTNNSGLLPFTGKGNAADIRYATNISPTSVINYNYQTASDYRNTDKLIIRKYPGAAGKGNLVNDIKMCRLSEIYLLKAEAQVALNDLSGAAETLLTLRNNRFSRPQVLSSYSNQTEGFKDVLLERRKELAYEGFRFLDLKRLGVMANEQISRDSRDCEINGACTLSPSDYRFALPIPNVEFNANSQISGQQNPGY